MPLRPRLKVEINYYRTKQIKEYDLKALSRTAFIHALTGKPVEMTTIHKVFNVLDIPEVERRGLIIWE